MKYKLDPEEQEILDAFERGDLKSIPNVQQEIELTKEAARNTFNKTKRINLRLTEQDFDLAHIKALEEGLPYQTLLSSVIHKYLSGRLTEKP
ncbi:MAG: antitoxin [SAR324 cluster bacterium]|nr:antitoxin [SAR324 cluster bacterium]